jgi:hypothetical protein
MVIQGARKANPIGPNHDGIMLNNTCGQPRGPENVDKSSNTREHRRSRRKCEDQNKLINMING